MTITITRLGPNSQALSYSSPVTQVELLAGLRSILEVQGWAVHDANAGPNAVCYRAAIADGNMAFKYMVLDVNTSAVLMTKVYESWNAVTHTGTNLAYNSDNGSFGQRLTLTQGGLIWVYANPRYAVFYSRTSYLQYGDLNGESFTGCIEISRDNADEVPGAKPIFAWVTGGQVQGEGVTASGTFCLSLPRTISGATGLEGIRWQTISTIVGRTGNSLSLLSCLPVAGNPLSTTASQFVFTPYSMQMDSTSVPNHVRGRLYGLKILAREVGVVGDTLNIRTGAGLFMDNSETSPLTPHRIVGSKLLGRFALPL